MTQIPNGNEKSLNPVEYNLPEYYVPLKNNQFDFIFAYKIDEKFETRHKSALCLADNASGFWDYDSTTTVCAYTIQGNLNVIKILEFKLKKCS